MAVQCRGQLVQGNHCWVFLAALNMADICALNVGNERQLILRNTVSDPDTAQIESKLFENIHSRTEHAWLFRSHVIRNVVL